MGSSTVTGFEQFSALVVDDCKMQRLIHKTLVKNLGLACHEVENGKEAVNLYESGASFDLILIDFDMPVMNGVEATRALRAMGVESKIIGVTARSREREKEMFMDAGLNYYQEKPLTRDMLVSILQDMKGDVARDGRMMDFSR